jgi:hypothetical protein
MKQVIRVHVFYHVITKEAVCGGLARVPPDNSCIVAQGQWSKAMHLLGTYGLGQGCLNYG